MPIVITPTGEYIDSVTGNPVGIPPQRPDIPRGGGAMSDQEMNMMAMQNIPPNMDMGMDSQMAAADLSDIDKVRLLLDMGLNEQDAIEAVVREKSMGTVRPEEFSGQQMPTQQNGGGLTDIYLDLGTYVKSFYSVIYAPSCVKIKMMGVAERRFHHSIKWNNAVPKIINQKFKKNYGSHT